MRGAAHGHGQRRHVVGEALRDGRHLFEASALGSRCAGDLVGGDAAHEAAAVVGVLARGVRHVLLRDHLDHVEALLLALLHGHVARQHVAGVVEHDVEHALALVGQLDGVDTGLRAGRGEDVAHHVDVHHALAHEALDGRLVAAAALRDDGDAIGLGQLLVDHHVVLAQLEDVGIGQGQALQQLGGEVLGIVDELLHLHGAPPQSFDSRKRKARRTLRQAGFPSSTRRPAPARSRTARWTWLRRRMCRWSDRRSCARGRTSRRSPRLLGRPPRRPRPRPRAH